MFRICAISSVKHFEYNIFSFDRMQALEMAKWKTGLLDPFQYANYNYTFIQYTPTNIPARGKHVYWIGLNGFKNRAGATRTGLDRVS